MYCDNKVYKLNVILIMHDIKIIYNCTIHAAHKMKWNGAHKMKWNVVTTPFPPFFTIHVSACWMPPSPVLLHSFLVSTLPFHPYILQHIQYVFTHDIYIVSVKVLFQ